MGVQGDLAMLLSACDVEQELNALRRLRVALRAWQDFRVVLCGGAERSDTAFEWRSGDRTHGPRGVCAIVVRDQKCELRVKLTVVRVAGA